MAKYIEKSALVAEIERLAEVKPIDEFQPQVQNKIDWLSGKLFAINSLRVFLNTLEVKEADLKKESELIANGIMIAVQGNKYHTCIYNPERCDFNHSHLWLAARKGIELGLKAQKGE